MIALGVLALVIGLLLIVVEAHVTTAGVAGVVGVLLTAGGVWLLFTEGNLGQLVAIPVAVGVGAAGLGVVGWVGRKVLTARHAPVQMGERELVGAEATVRTWDGVTGQVEAGGALWQARLGIGYDGKPAVGESVVVEGIHGLTLLVRRREPWELPL